METRTTQLQGPVGLVGLISQHTAVLASNGVFSNASDTQFIIIVDNDTMVPSTGALSLKKNILCNIVHKLVISSTISVIYQNDGKSIFFSELLPE